MQGRIAATLFVLALLGGCGDDSQSDQEAVTDSVLTVGDLPDGAVVRSELPNGPCDPSPILAVDGASTAESRTFSIGPTDMKEAVGVYAGERTAEEVYDALNSEERRKCIGNVINAFGPPGSGSAKALPPRDLEIGDEAELMRFLVSQRGSQSSSYVDAVTVRSGRGISTLILLTRQGKAPDAVILDVSEAAAELLASATG